MLDSLGDGGDKYSRHIELRTEAPLPAPEVRDSALLTVRRRVFISVSAVFMGSYEMYTKIT